MNCYLCGSSHTSRLFSNHNFDYYKCFNCQLYQIYPLPSNKDLNTFYLGEYKMSIGKHRDNLKIWQRIMNLIELFKKPCSLLGIGCSYGGLLVEARKRGWKVCGIELSQEAAAYANKKGLNVSCKSLERSIFFKNKKRFDVILSWHVLEHYLNPIKEIRNISGLLKKNGMFIFSSPNANSLEAKLLGKFWGWFDAPAHLFLFSKRNIKYLLAKADLKLVKIITRRGYSMGIIVQFFYIPVTLVGYFLRKIISFKKNKKNKKIEKFVNEQKEIGFLYPLYNFIIKFLTIIQWPFDLLTLPLRKFYYSLGYGPELIIIAEKIKK